MNSRFGLLGEKLSHSLSPTIHAYFGKYDYDLKEIARSELIDFLIKKDFNGLNVTIPYKEKVIPFCERISKKALLCRAVNTIVKRPDGSLFGDNTDFDGFKETLLNLNFAPKGKKCLILGTGGAAKTAKAVFESMYASSVILVSRKGPITYENVSSNNDARIIVNATPVGMFPNVFDAPNINLDNYPHLEAAVDLIYNPRRPMWLQSAQEKGIKTANGLRMLVTQAALACEVFTNTLIYQDEIEDIIKKLDTKNSNVVLIGMPGSGKTTLGRIYAARNGLKFVDTDKLIELRAGISIPEIFEHYGEEPFRRLETKVIQSLATERGLVIATGGGSVLKKENVQALRLNGKIIRICRPISELSKKKRPISLTSDIFELARIREPFYAAAADATIDTSNINDSIKNLEATLLKL